MHVSAPRLRGACRLTFALPTIGCVGCTTNEAVHPAGALVQHRSPASSTIIIGRLSRRPRLRLAARSCPRQTRQWQPPQSQPRLRRTGLPSSNKARTVEVHLTMKRHPFAHLRFGRGGEGCLTDSPRAAGLQRSVASPPARSTCAQNRSHSCRDARGSRSSQRTRPRHTLYHIADACAPSRPRAHWWQVTPRQAHSAQKARRARQRSATRSLCSHRARRTSTYSRQQRSGRDRDGKGEEKNMGPSDDPDQERD